MKRSSAGYVLLPVAVAIALIGVIAYLTASESAVETSLGSNEIASTRAEYVAQAGMQHALRQVAQSGCGPYTVLSNVPFDLDQYSASLSSSLGSTTAYTIAVEADSWIRSDQPTINHATDIKLHTRNEVLGIERPLLRYDLSPIPADASILSATAWFYIAIGHAAGAIDIHRTSADWNEADVTWDSMSANMHSEVLASIPDQAGAGLWLAVNLTAQVQAWINGQPNFGITLNSTVDGVHGQYNSRESANPPWLEVVVGTAPSALAQLKAKGTLADGVSHSIQRDITLQQRPASFSRVQLNSAAGKDATLNSFYNERDFGNHELQVSTGFGSTQEHALLQFEMSSIPSGARILSARLELYHYLTTSTQVDPGVEVHRVTRSWVEGTHDGTGTADGASWDTWDGVSNWTSSGGDYAVRPVDSSAISAATGDWESWEIGDLVKSWIDGSHPNHGLLLKGTGMIDVRFASKEDINAALRPRLSIEYSCACGQVCVAPQSAGRILMAVVDPTTLVADDAYKKALFETWGYSVTLISESANQASFDAAMSAADVVFISETVNAAQLGNKLVGASIGVVTQDGDYNADLGIAPGAAWTVGTAIDITDTAHYITAPFTSGALSIYNATMEQMTVSGGAAAGLQSLADSAGNSSLATLETGAALSGGGNAAGRRVMLPLGRSGFFNWEQLNSNGRLLVQRALNWAGRLDEIGNNLLLVVVNRDSLTTRESDRMALIQSWGYQVELINGSDTQANFNAALAANQVVYLAVDIADSNLAGKLDNAAIGVVNEEAELSDDLGLAQNPIYRNLSQIDIVDNSHFITESLPTGLLSFVDSNQPVHMQGGEKAPGLLTLAQSFDAGANWEPSLAVIETGGQLRAGISAAGRRVQLPWGGEGFDIAALNTAGRLLMLRAIQWAGSMAGGGPPLAHWKLDETSGDAALDSIAGHHGSLANNPSWKTGLLQGSLDFDGIDDSVGIGPAPDLDNLFGSGATLTSWIYARGWGEGGFGRIADKSDATSPNDGWALNLDGSGEALMLQTGFSGSRGRWTTPSASIQLNRWHHVAVVYNSSTENNDPAIYIDGTVQTLSEDSSPSGSSTSDAAHDFTIGNHAAAGSRTFNGRLDDIRLYDRLLSAAQVGELAQFPGPVAHWPLDDGVDFTAVDIAGGNDGSLIDGPAWASGLLAGALVFDGVDDHVSAGSFDVSGSGITMMGWFRAVAIASDDPRIISKANGINAADAWWQLSTTDSGADGYLRMRIKAGGVTTTLADSTMKLVADLWYFAAATYDADSGQMRLYLDGVEVVGATHAVGGALEIDPTIGVAIGANGTAERFFNGLIDDPRVYDYALPAEQIQAIFDAVEVPIDGLYYERYQSWKASVDNSWQTVDLGVFGVPPGAVVEVAMMSSKTDRERWAGVRAIGSSLDRRFRLNEAESGGTDSVTMHVQADASRQIQHYAERKNEITFALLGFWTGVVYTELFSPLTAGATNSWVAEDLSDDGLVADVVAEMVIANDSPASEYLAGVRSLGSGLQRRFDLKEAENGGVDALSMMVNTGATTTVELFAELPSAVDFYIVGYWSTPPGVYTELEGSSGQVGVAASWQPTDVSGFGIPAAAVAQFVLANGSDATENQMGVREIGSSTARLIDLQEAESGGFDLVSLHVTVDGAAEVEWYAESGGGERLFHPVGWWLMTP